ncbi:MAG: integrase domain-containing protein [Gammaproteobacteria bacterium]|nr:integrase domain-containing protein [Gammaproteobacteria bacterium]MBU1601785.1 integrase domain-containing protein [Gammaproteobacteria bacterium]MBU2432157.1 integrase domain-containing protein [Gammaproteobacteria bacterium]MBU2450450.1 integrase domain-containing protein [Gammaproteobacteria bacterium]
MSRTSLADQLLPKRFRDELDRIINHNNQKNHSRLRDIPRDSSRKTRRERRGNLRLIFAQLSQLGYRLESPTHLKPKHVQAVFTHWMEKGLAAKSIHGLFSNLRSFCRWIDKEGMIEDIGVYAGGREHLVRKTAATEDLSWEAQGIDVDKFIQNAGQLDPRLAALLQLQRYFGLRAKESLELRPWRATALGQDHLYITDGTKGGKHRMIPIRTERQREIVDRAKEIVGKQLNAQMRWPDKTWRQAQSHFYYLMGQLGATREELGVTAHGLRHGFLQDEYAYYAGVAAPIKNHGILPTDRLEHKKAMLAVSLEAGHYRESATGMYCGSVGHQLRPKSVPSITAPSLNDKENINEERSSDYPDQAHG